MLEEAGTAGKLQAVRRLHRTLRFPYKQSSWLHGYGKLPLQKERDRKNARSQA